MAQRNNYITLDRGAADGVGKDMSVISGTGVVGRIVHVSAHFSTAVSVLSSLQPVSGHLRDGTTGRGDLDPGRTDAVCRCVVSAAVPAETAVKKGDTVWATSYSLFPPETMIGTVTDIRKVLQTGQHLLVLRPSTTSAT